MSLAAADGGIAGRGATTGVGEAATGAMVEGELRGICGKQLWRQPSVERFKFK